MSGGAPFVLLSLGGGQESEPSHVSSHALEKSLFLAGRVTLGGSIIRFIVLVVWCRPVMDLRRSRRVRSGLGGRGRSWSDLARVTPIVPSHRRGRASVVRVEDAHLTVGRRPALVHRRIAASIVRGDSERDDVQANGKSRIICLSPGVPCRQSDPHRQNRQSQCAHWNYFLQVVTTLQIVGSIDSSQCARNRLMRVQREIQLRFLRRCERSEANPEMHPRR